mmetsp:Transcript_16066/g.24441  ORF Transcript_16066/g.24441 Transcript_16066/m.24441 type:complete len:274 (-) Transcript_16066:118-939(-)
MTGRAAAVAAAFTLALVPSSQPFTYRPRLVKQYFFESTRNERQETAVLLRAAPDGPPTPREEETVRYWKTTNSGLFRYIDDRSGDGPPIQPGNVVRIRCSTRILQGDGATGTDAAYLEPPPEALVVSRDRNTGLTFVYEYGKGTAVWEEALEGIRAGGRRRVSVTGGAVFRREGDAGDREGVRARMETELVAIEDDTGADAVLARALSSGNPLLGMLALFVRPVLTPGGLCVLLLLLPLLVKKTGNAVAAAELYLDVDADNALQYLLDWKWKF